MSDPNDQNFQVPPPPPSPPEVRAERPTKLWPIAIGLFVIGLAILVLGIIKVVPGGIGTGGAVAFLGALLFALSFIPLPQRTGDEEPAMTAFQKVTGIFFEPTRVFRNLRPHPRWLAAFLIIGFFSVLYTIAFTQRLTPERIVNYTMDKLTESSFAPPPDRLAIMREEAVEQAKNPIQRAGGAAKAFVGVFVFICILGSLYLLGVLAFGGKINFWQALAATFYATLPVIVIQKVLSLVILYIKSPEDIHPILGQETLVQDNLGILFSPAVHPVLFVLSSSIGFLSFYGLWLKATGLQNAGQRVSSSAAWGTAVTFWVLGTLLLTVFTALFPQFIS